MGNQSKIRLLRLFIITSLILPAIFPGSALALTQDFSSSTKAVLRGRTVLRVPQKRQSIERLAPLAGNLPSGTPFLPSLLVNTVDTSIWSHPSTDPAGIAYWSPTGKLLISDTEIEESPQPFWDGFNVFQSTLTGSLSSNCTTFTNFPLTLTYNNFTDEPSGITFKPDHTHIFFSDDTLKKIFDVSLGADNTYCTSDDTVTSVSVGVSPFNVGDPEDIAYGNNKLYIGGGQEGEVWVFDLGANGILGGGDDSSGALTHFDTVALGFSDVEGIAYNNTDGTLYIVSTIDNDTYLGEVTTSGSLLRAYDLSYLGHVRRSGLTVAPSSVDPSSDNIYIVSRGVDNAVDPNNNDGKIWEIDISNPDMPDLIFKDGFESGNLSAWTSSNTNNGKLSASAAAALFDNYGMRAVISGTTGMDVTDDTPTLETRYRARFYFDPNSIAMAASDSHEIFQGYVYLPQSSNFTNVLQVQFRYSSGNYQVRGRILDDAATFYPTSGGWFSITDASHYIEFDWSAATAVGANNGYLTLWVDGSQVQNVPGIDNDTRRIDRAKLGPTSGLDVGTSGTYFFDAFESRRETYIGFVPTPPTVTSVLRAGSNPTGAAEVDYTVTFSESVTGVDSTDFGLNTAGISGAFVSAVNGSGSTYTVTVNTGTGNGTVRLDVIDDDSIIDIEGTPLGSGFTVGQVYTIEKDSPFVSSVTRNDANPTNAAAVGFTVTFSEAVTGVDVTDFQLTTTGAIAGASINNVTGSNATYTVTVNTGSGDGTIRLDVLDDNTIMNTMSNSLSSGFTDGEVYTVIKSTPFANVNLKIAGGDQANYSIAPKYSVRASYAGVNNGPVLVQSMNGVPIVASERVAYSPDGGTTWTSHSELMGLPANLVHTSYTFPYYNNADLNSQLRFGNVGTSSTTVSVIIGGQNKGSFTLIPNESKRVSYAGLSAGPVVIRSNGQPIIASMRVAYTPDAGVTWTSFSEMMGLPSNKLTNSYTFPWYNNASLDSQLRFGNVGTANTNVTVTINGVIKGTYPLAPNQSQRVSYSGLDSGPVKITSSGNVPIIASLRVAYTPDGGATWTDFSEMMGLPTNALSTSYSFPAYNNVDHNSQLRFGNVGTVSTDVKVFINGVLKGTYPTLPNQSRRISYVGLDSGPVVIQSNGQPIIASLRVAYTPDAGVTWTSFAEMMGLPQSQLTTSYYFPWYNNLDLDTQLRVGVP